MGESTKLPSKRQRAIDAGARVFLRFGFARATMGDIAHAAGMSRPALYLIFGSKEEVFEAVVARWIEDSLARIATGLATRSTLGEKLRFVRGLPDRHPAAAGRAVGPWRGSWRPGASDRLRHAGFQADRPER